MPVAPDIRLQVVEAVAKPGGRAMLLDTHGHSAGWTSLADALVRDLAFAVTVREHMLVLDCDADKGLGWLSSAESALYGAGAELVLVCSSGRAGHSHRYWAGSVGWTGEDLRSVARATGVHHDALRTGSNRIRPPYARHASLLTRALPTEPDEPTDVLRALRRRPGAVRLNPEWGPRLAGTATRGLSLKADGTVRREPSVFSVALGYVNAGEEFATFARHAVRSPWVTSWLEELPPNKRPHELRRKWEQALKQVREHPPASKARANGQLAAMQATVDTHPWRGRAGETDRTTLQHLLDVGVEIGSLDVGRAVRTMAESLGVADSTVVRSLGRLREAGLLERAPGARERGEAQRHRLLPKIDACECNTSLPPPIAKSRSIASPGLSC